MDDTPINLENILEQAPKWTFAGDFALLQWMNQISEVFLRSQNTNNTNCMMLNFCIHYTLRIWKLELQKLQRLLPNSTIMLDRSTNIALDNVANSLTTLQFGNQFVECRVQDDDETLANANEASSDGENVSIAKKLLIRECGNGI